MRHSLLITLEYPPQHGGVANYYHGIVANWPYGILEVMHVHLSRLWPRWLSVFFQVRSKIHHPLSSIDLLQVGQVLPLGYVALLVKWFYGIPYLVYTHGMDVLVPQNKAHKKLLLKFILKRAKVVVANSEFTKGEVVKLGILSDKIVVVHPCVSLGVSPRTTRLGEPSAFVGLNGSASLSSVTPRNQARSASAGLFLGDTPRYHSCPIILTVSRLVARKGIDTVLAALPEVFKKVPNLQYVVIGTGPELQNYKLAATNYKLGDHVTFLGEVSDEEKIAWYRRASVFVLTPRQIDGDVEGFGMVYLEANWFGLPVVGSRTGGVSEAVQDGINGLLVSPDNPQETSDALVQLLTQKSLTDTLGIQGQERVNKEFTWGLQLQKLRQYFS